VGPGAPLLVSVGGAEAEEFIRQSRDFATAWEAAGNRAALLIPADANHITVVLDEFAVQGSLLNAAMMRLIREGRAEGGDGGNAPHRLE
jgi:arylformamidase